MALVERPKYALAKEMPRLEGESDADYRRRRDKEYKRRLRAEKLAANGGVPPKRKPQN